MRIHLVCSEGHNQWYGKNLLEDVLKVFDYVRAASAVRS